MKYFGFKIILILFILSQFLQTKINDYALKSKLNYVLLVVLVFLIIDFLIHKKQLFLLLKKIKFKTIPKNLKIIICFVFIAQTFCLFRGKTYYPFADVGMFREARVSKKDSDAYIVPRYYFKKNNENVIIQLRKSHTFLPNRLLNLRYNNEYTFSASYHYKSKKENYDFLKLALEESGDINLKDTLFIGLETVNFKTKEVTFNSNTDAAINYINTHKHYYGPLFIPESLK